MNNTIDIIAFVKYVLRMSHIVVIGIISGIGVALLINQVMIATIYTGEAKYYLTSSEEAVSYGALQATTTIMDDYLSMIASKAIAKRAIERNNLDMDVDSVMKMVSVTNPSKTHLLAITVEAEDPHQAEEVMEAMSYQIVNYIPSLMDGSYVTVFEEPEISVDNGNEKKIINIAFSIIIGGLISVIFLLARFITKPTTDDPQTISAEFREIRTYFLSNGSNKVLFRTKTKQEKTEQRLEAVESELLFDLTLGDSKNKIVLVTSPTDKEDGSYIAEKIWKTLQQQGVKAVYVDKNLKLLKSEEISKEQENEKISILAQEHQGSLGEWIDLQKKTNEMIIIDAAPVLQSSDPLILARYADKVVIVVRYGYTLMQDLRSAVQRFTNNKYSVQAIVLNQYR